MSKKCEIYSDLFDRNLYHEKCFVSAGWKICESLTHYYRIIVYLPTKKLYQWHYIITAKTTIREPKNSRYQKIIEVNTQNMWVDVG